MKIDRKKCPLVLHDDLVSILEKDLADLTVPLRAVTITYRDPGYDPERGGFHPVEIRIGREGVIQYVTDFAYVGLPPFAELAKEIDFDFSLGLFQHFGREHPIQAGRALFDLWQRNFVAYHRMGVYETSVDVENG